MHKHIVIGSRGSDLALWQARFLQTELSNIGCTSEIKIIKTQGDKIQHLSLEKLEGKGFFTKEIEDALLSGDIDAAVHSHKDLPTENATGLIIAAVSHREDPSELLLIRKDKVDEMQLFSLAQNAIVGTSSSRRTVQMGFFRPDVICNDIRGNVPTRVQKLRNGNFDAIMLAFAGVHRLQLDISDLHTVKIAPEKFIPAPAQGVLAFQCRASDEAMLAILSKINHSDVAETIGVERKVMNLFQGGCHMPLGVYCHKQNDIFMAFATQTAGKSLPVSRLFMSAASTTDLANNIFRKLPAQHNKSVFITSTETTQQPALQLLQQKGFKVVAQSCIGIKPVDFIFNPICDWIFFTSKNGVNIFFDTVYQLSSNIKIATIGEATAAAVNAFGYKVSFIGEGTTENIASSFNKIAANTKVIFAGAKNRQSKVTTLVASFAMVEHLTVYDNIPAQIPIIQADILVFTSPLNVDGYLINNTIHPNQTVIAIGNTTGSYLNAKGYHNVHLPPQQHLLSIAELICGL